MIDLLSLRALPGLLTSWVPDTIRDDLDALPGFLEVARRGPILHQTRRLIYRRAAQRHGVPQRVLEALAYPWPLAAVAQEQIMAEVREAERAAAMLRADVEAHGWPEAIRRAADDRLAAVIGAYLLLVIHDTSEGA